MGVQQSFSSQKQKNKSQIPECGDESPSGQINIQGKQNSPLGRLLQTRWVYPKKSATQGEVPEEEAWPPRERWRRVCAEGRGEAVREKARRVNADSSTKAATAAEGREEHGKRAKVKGNSGGFKFKATVSLCISTAPIPPPPHPHITVCPHRHIKSEAAHIRSTSRRKVEATRRVMFSACALTLWVVLTVKNRKCSATCLSAFGALFHIRIMHRWNHKSEALRL